MSLKGCYFYLTDYDKEQANKSANQMNFNL